MLLTALDEFFFNSSFARLNLTWPFDLWMTVWFTRLLSMAISGIQIFHKPVWHAG